MKPYRYFGTGFKTNVGSATACSSPPSHCQTRAASCSAMPQAHAKATHVLAKRQWSCQVRGCPGTMPTYADALRGSAPSRRKCDRLPNATDQTYVRLPVSPLQPSADIGTDAGTAKEASRVQQPSYTACCRLWHGSLASSADLTEATDVVVHSRRCCCCRSDFGIFSTHRHVTLGSPVRGLSVGLNP